MKRIETALLGAVLVVAAACGGSSNTSTGPNSASATVNASASLVFAPNSVSINVGQTVAFVFGAVEHNVTFNAAVSGAPANVGNTANSTVTRTFNTAGTFVFSCTLHAGMGGQVVVGGGTNNTYSGY